MKNKYIDRDGYAVNYLEVDEFNNPVKRTKINHPYSYDGFVTYRNGDKIDSIKTKSGCADRVILSMYDLEYYFNNNQ